MKKLLMALSVAAVFTACGDDSTKTEVETKSDSTMMSTDTSSMMNSAPVVADTTKTDSSHLKTDAPAQ